MNKASLLVLAGGMGSRYKSQKQIDKITDQESLMEFALFDALNAGFQKFIFIINDQFPLDYQAHLNEILSSRKGEVHFVTQNLSQSVPIEFHSKLMNRTKPLGTAHAILCAKEFIQESFVTINADDFYGRTSFEKAFAFIQNKTNDNFGIIGFELGKTLSENGQVSRGICKISNDYLTSVEEHIEIEKRKDLILGKNSKLEEVILKPTDMVSMNCWILNPKFFEFAQSEFLPFLETSNDLLKDEFYLPNVIDHAIKMKKVQVNVIPSQEKWMGLTYAEDKQFVQKELQQLIQKNSYLHPLWNQN